MLLGRRGGGVGRAIPRIELEIVDDVAGPLLRVAVPCLAEIPKRLSLGRANIYVKHKARTATVVVA